MRVLLAAVSGLAFVLGSSIAIAAPGDTVEEEAVASETLAGQLRVALVPERCLTTEEALAAIQTTTDGVDVQTIATAIDILDNDDGWCAPERAAISSADEAAQLALAQSGATGGVGGTGGPGVPFGAGGVGSPGGGGGSNYPG